MPTGGTVGQILENSASGTGVWADASGTDPHTFLATSGATPSLDVGSYNYFDSGTLTANTTVSFTNVPTNAKWKYSFNAGHTDSWDVSTTVPFASRLLDLTADTPKDVAFSPDGTKMFILARATDKVFQYNLTTPWSVQSATHVNNLSIVSQDTTCTGLFFRPDGTKMYMTGSNLDRVSEYDLSADWDVSTAVFLRHFYVGTQEANPESVFFKPDGTKMYITGSSGDDVNEYNLSTAWDVSSSAYSQKFSVSSEENSPTGLHFKPDGTKMYITGLSGHDVNEYDLSTAWDVSTASYVQKFNLDHLGLNQMRPEGIFFDGEGTKMYIVSSDYEEIYEYNIGTTYTLTLPASVVGYSSVVSSNRRITYEFQTADSGTTVNLIGENQILIN